MQVYISHLPIIEKYNLNVLLSTVCLITSSDDWSNFEINSLQSILCIFFNTLYEKLIFIVSFIHCCDSCVDEYFYMYYVTLSAFNSCFSSVTSLFIHFNVKWGPFVCLFHDLACAVFEGESEEYQCGLRGIRI